MPYGLRLSDIGGFPCLLGVGQKNNDGLSGGQAVSWVVGGSWSVMCRSSVTVGGADSSWMFRGLQPDHVAQVTIPSTRFYFSLPRNPNLLRETLARYCSAYLSRAASLARKSCGSSSNTSSFGCVAGLSLLLLPSRDSLGVDTLLSDGMFVCLFRARYRFFLKVPSVTAMPASFKTATTAS